MLKMYQAASHGGEARFWEETWSDDLFTEALRFCDIDPLRPLIERLAPEGSRLLEGGCGRGQYVAYWGSRGVNVVGLDFAQETLRRLKGHVATARLCAGDVAALPLADGSFNVYFSGGVVEHFEGGPLPALQEAHRVLSDDGVLLVSIPYLSPLRRLSRLWMRDRCFVTETRVEPARVEKMRFWQYAFGRREFGRLLEQAGFYTQETFPYALAFGLCDLPFVSSLLARRESRKAPTPGASAGTAGDRSIPLLTRLLVSEDRSVRFLGPLVGAALRFGGNMLLFVCIKKPR